MPDNFNLEEIDEVNSTNDVVRLILALLSGIKLLTAALGFHFFTEDLYVAIANIIPVLIILWSVWDAKREKDRVKQMALQIARKERPYED